MGFLRRRTRAGFTLIELMIVVAIIAIISAIAIPMLVRARMDASEGMVVTVLRAIQTAQEEFRLAVVVDTDVDNKGEFGFLPELTGGSPPRVDGGLAASKVTPPFLSFPLGLADSGGLVDRGGFQFMIYLPTDTVATSMTSATVPAGNRLHANAQELRYVCYAWPVSYQNSGKRCFALNHEGVLVVASNESTRYSGSAVKPVATAALDTGGTNPANLDASLGGSSTGDGQAWSPVQ